MPVISSRPPIKTTPPISRQLYTPTQAAINYTLQLWERLGQPDDPLKLREELEKKGVPPGPADALAKIAFKYRRRVKEQPEPKAAAQETAAEDMTGEVSEEQAQETTGFIKPETTTTTAEAPADSTHKVVLHTSAMADSKYRVMERTKETLDKYQEILDNSHAYYDHKSYSDGLPLTDEMKAEGWERHPDYDNMIRRPTDEYLEAKENYDKAQKAYNKAAEEYKVAKEQYENAVKNYGAGSTTPTPESATTEAIYEYRSHSEGLPVPEGWERAPGYENLIRQVVKEASVSLSSKERKAADGEIREQVATLEAQIEDIHKRMKELEQQGLDWEARNEAMIKLREELDAIRAQEAVLNTYLSITGDDNLDKVDSGYILSVMAYTSPGMSTYIGQDGSIINIFDALNDPKVSDETLQRALGLSDQKFAYLKEMQPYVKPDGSVDVIRAVKDERVREDSVKFVMGLDQSQYSDLKTLARYTDVSGHLETWRMIIDGKDQETMERLTGMSSSDYDKWQQLKPYIGKDGSPDLPAAVKAGLTSPDDYIGWNVTADDIQWAADYNSLQEAGHINEEGGIENILKIFIDGKLVEAFQNVTGLSDEQIKLYKGISPYAAESGEGIDLGSLMCSNEFRDGKLDDQLAEIFGKDAVRQYRNAIEEIEKWYESKGGLVKIKEGETFTDFSLHEALEAGISEETLKAFFTEESIAEAKEILKSHTLLPDGNLMLNEDIQALKENDPEMYDILINKGYETYAREFEKRDQLFRSKHTLLPDGTWMLNEDIETIKEHNTTLYEILTKEGYTGYQRVLKDAEEMVEKYKSTEYEGGRPKEAQPISYDLVSALDTISPNTLAMVFGDDLVKEMQEYKKQLDILKDYEVKDPETGQTGYDIVSALVSDDENVINAVNYVFKDNPEVIDAAKTFIKENYEIQWEKDEWGGIPYQISKLWRSITPWKEEKGETFGSALVEWIETWPLPDLSYKSDEPPSNPIEWIHYSTSTFGDIVIDWIKDTYIPAVEKWTNMTDEFFAQQLKEHSQEGELRGSGQILLGISQGIRDIFTTIPATIVGVGASSLAHGYKGDLTGAFIEPAALAAGVASWFTGIPYRVSTNPAYEVPYTMVILGGEPLRSIIKLAKKAGIALDPRKITNTNLALQADIARAALPHGMDAFTARSMIEAVEFAWGGKDKVPAGLKKLTPLEQAILTAVVKNKDVIFKDKTGRAVGHVTPFQMAIPQTAFHVTGNLKPLAAELAKQGYMEVKPEGTYGGLWISQQMPQAFLTRGGSIADPGGVMVRFSPKDLKELPTYVMEAPTFELMKTRMAELAKSGKLEPGIYPVFKYATALKKYELELFVSPGFRFYSNKGTWYAPEKRGTASMSTTSLISYVDPALKMKLDSIKAELKSLKGLDKVDKEGKVISQREPYPHPEIGGDVRVRLTGVVRRPDTGGIMLTIDKMDPKGVYSLPGGRFQPINGKGKHTGLKLETFEDGIRDQILSETNIDIQNVKFLDTYLGKVNRHSMHGSHIYYAEPKNLKAKFDLNRYMEPGKTELVDAIWWDGKSKITVNPATYYILKGLADRFNLDMSRVTMSRRIKELIEESDSAITSRLKENRPAAASEVKAAFNAIKKRLLVEKTRLESKIAKERLEGTKEIKEGQEIPLMIVSSKKAAQEGLGVPKLRQLYLAELLNPYVSLKKWQPWRIRLRQRPVTGESGAPSVGSPFYSTYTGINLSKSLLESMRQRAVKAAEIIRKDLNIKSLREAYRRMLDMVLSKKDAGEMAARIENRVAERMKKDKTGDSEAIYIEELTKEMNKLMKEYFEPGGKVDRWLKERNRNERYLESRGYLPYKAPKGYKGLPTVEKIPEPNLENLERVPAAGYQEYKPESMLEYALVYPRLFTKAYPKYMKESPVEAIKYLPKSSAPYKAGAEEKAPAAKYDTAAMKPYYGVSTKYEPKPGLYKPTQPKGRKGYAPPVPPKKRPPEYPPEYPPKLVSRPSIRPGAGDVPKEKKKRKPGAGDMWWRQGLFWIRLIPRTGGGYEVEYSKSPPPGALLNKRTPEETYFTRGGPENLPARIKFDMGLMDVKITPTGEPNLRFKRV